MDKKIIIGVLALVVILGGAYMITRSTESDQMMEQKEPAMEQKGEAMEVKKDAMMEKKDEVMEKADTMMEKKDEVMEKGDAMMEKKDAMMMKGGQYIAYDASKIAFAKDGKVVLFFNASWCPQCKAIDADIKASLSDIPADTLILNVDYDSNKDLRTKYGVTTQHTFVQVDENGNSKGLWVGGNTLEEVTKRLK